jgi:hypothetical protein
MRWGCNFNELWQHGGRVDFSYVLRASLLNDNHRMNLISAGSFSLDSTFNVCFFQVPSNRCSQPSVRKQVRDFFVAWSWQIVGKWQTDTFSFWVLKAKHDFVSVLWYLYVSKFSFYSNCYVFWAQSQLDFDFDKVIFLIFFIYVGHATITY